MVVVATLLAFFVVGGAGVGAGGVGVVKWCWYRTHDKVGRFYSARA